VTAAGLSATGWGVIAIVVVIALVLIYRILRREPLDRVVRFGVFIERQRFSTDGEQITERKEWPRDQR
jgi:hypothetical protein